MDAPLVPRSWIAVKGTVLPSILPEIVGYTTIAGGLYGLQLCGVVVPMSALAHSIVGIALGMLLVFRTNVSYDRYWEARQRWSGIAAAARNLCRGASHHRRSAELVRLVSAWLHALKHGLRGEESWVSLRPFLSEEVIRGAHRAGHPSLAIARDVTDWVRIAEADGAIQPELARALEGYVAQLIEHQGACERIRATPVPFAYMTHVRQLLTVYLASLPLALVGPLGVWSLPGVALVAFGLLGIDRAGREIEDPFGTDDNDLPLDSIVEAITRDLTVFAGAGAPSTERARRS
jgi:ion channel-forming bestrophin family protein